MTPLQDSSGPRERVGVVVNLPATSPIWNKEIQRAEGDGTGSPASGTETILETIPGSRTRYVDDGSQASFTAGASYIYRYRFVRIGASDGSWSGWTDEKRPSGVWGQKSSKEKPAKENALTNFRVTDRDRETIRYEWKRGVLVDQVFVYSTVVAQPVTADSWPETGSAKADRVLDTENDYTAQVPRPGKVRLLQFEPRDAKTDPGEIQRASVRPATPREDRIVSMGLSVDEQRHVDLSIETEGCESIRYAYSKAGEPTHGAIESGTVAATTNGTIQDVVSLGIDSDGNLDEAWVGVAAYSNDDGTGPDGAGDHGDIEIQRIGGEGLGGKKWALISDPQISSTDSDPNALTGCTISWSPCTVKAVDYSFGVEGGSESGKDGQTTHYLYYEIDSASVEIVTESDLDQIVGFKKLFLGSTTTPEDVDDGSDSGSGSDPEFGGEPLK